MNQNPYQNLRLTTLKQKVEKAAVWLKANKKHPQFFEYLKQYHLMWAAYKAADNRDAQQWCSGVIEYTKKVIPGIKVQN